MHGRSLLWAEFVWADFVMGRVCNGPSLLWAEMSSYRIDQVLVTELQCYLTLIPTLIITDLGRSSGHHR